MTMSGGEHELAASLEQRSRENPERFAALAFRLPDPMPPSYFEAILRGVAQSPCYDAADQRDTAFASGLILRCHALPRQFPADDISAGSSSAEAALPGRTIFSTLCLVCGARPKPHARDLEAGA